MTHHQPLLRIPVTSRSAVPGPAPLVAEARTGVKERLLVVAVCQLSGQPCVFEKPEKKKRPAVIHGQCRVHTRFPLFFYSFSLPFFFLSHRRLSRLGPRLNPMQFLLRPSAPSFPL
ncbi:hypothetical protein BGY98DRAFT_682436 [Russula aff. rugulosa BPL654]|nr:hypothetical protein BGY98DRAFT_682436 [Russula aff. rugulosa BPL654]